MACLTKCSHLTPVLNLTFALPVDEEQGARKEMRKCSWKKQNAVFVSKLKQSFGINTDGATIVYINEAYICSTFFPRHHVLASKVSNAHRPCTRLSMGVGHGTINSTSSYISVGVASTSERGERKYIRTLHGSGKLLGIGPCFRSV